MDALLQDLRHGVRLLVKNPGISLIIVLTFGLGISLTTLVYSIVNGVLFKGLPLPESHRVLSIDRTEPPNGERTGITVHDLEDWREQQTVFDGIAAMTIGALNLADTERQPERYTAGIVSANMFDVLAVNPVLGRRFREGEDRPGAQPVIIIGYDVWQTRFGGEPSVLGQTIRGNGIQRTIVGVMPQGFLFPDREQLWIPLELDALGTPRDAEAPHYYGLARLKAGVSIREALTQMTAVAERLAVEYPEANRDVGVALKLFTMRYTGEMFGPVVLTLLGAVIGVLLIVCANVANLLLARATLRTREVSVRTALGASRIRIVRQLLTEVLIVAIIGGLLGYVLGTQGVKWFTSMTAGNPPPFWITFDPDHRVMLFAASATLIAAVMAGMFPALRASRVNISESLKDESRGASSLKGGRFTGGLVVAEIAVSCGLLIVAGLMIKSSLRLNTIELPFSTENIFTARISLPQADYADTASRLAFYEDLLPRLEALPGVESATLSDGLPARGNGTRVFEVEGQSYATEEDYPIAREGIVTPGYFRTFGVDLLQGRAFDSRDRHGSQPVAIVNASFAGTFFPGASVLGKRIRMGRGDEAARWLEVIGVVPDMKMEGLANLTASPAGFYIPFLQSGVGNNVNVALKTAGPPMELTTDVRRAVASVDPNLPIHHVMSMKLVIEDVTWVYRIFGPLFMLLGFVAMFLAAIGLYGVMSFAVSRRTREMGIRMALGAQGRQLIGLTMRKGTVQLAIGLGIGIGLAVAAVSPLQWILYDVSARDPLVFGSVFAVLAAVGLLASFIPARRATKVDPVTALGAE
ncbi:MAG: ABC transporter permease [Gemmatimonadota bacterium]|nr:MAG: ABC transporter permease [Gemmatimonadota bacterium]